MVDMQKEIIKAYKYRIYPNKQQEEMLLKHFGCSRFVYNKFLFDRQEQYRLTGKSDNYYKQLDIIGELCNDKKAIYRYPTGHAKVSRLGGDREELVKLYEMGRSDMEAIKEDIYKLIK